MFQRALAGWATDLMALRQRGLDRPCERLGLDSDRGRGQQRAASGWSKAA